MSYFKQNRLIRAALQVLSEGYKVTYNKYFEWESDKEFEVYNDSDTQFTIVISMLLTEDSYIPVSSKEEQGEVRHKVFGLAKDGKYYFCVYTDRTDCKRIITAWPADSSRAKKYVPMLKGSDKKDLIEHLVDLEQEIISERKVTKMFDWIDYPIDDEFWDKELPDMKNVAKIMEGTSKQYWNQMNELGEKNFFEILEKTNGSIDLGDGQRGFYYYPITAEDVQKYT